MATAIRLGKLDSGGSVVGNIDFDRKEVLHSTVAPYIRSNIQRAQKGAPTLFIITDEYHLIDINVRIFGTATENKLTELRNFIMAGGVVRVYPRYYQDTSIYYDCVIEPGSLLLLSSFSGESMAGKNINLKFLETDDSSQYVVSEEITIE